MTTINRRKGLTITGLGILAYTPDSLLIRLAAVESFTYVFLRGLIVSGMLILRLASRRRGTGQPVFAGLNRWGLFAALLNGTGGLLFICAFAHTTVANVLVTIAAQPVVAGLLAWLFLREPVSRATLCAMAGTAVGIAIVAGASIGKPSLIGDGAAFLAMTINAGYYVVLRRHATKDMQPAVALSGALSAALAFALLWLTGIGWSGFAALGWSNIGWTVGNCVLLVPFAMAMLAAGARYLPAAEVALLLLIEVVLGPLWVWWILGEEPPTTTLIGGAVILFSVAAHALMTLRRSLPRD
jgi:drug/metabolite transporter (DMT)-like permease